MAKKIVGFVKLQVPAGKANPSPELIGKVTLKSASLYYGDASLAGRLIAMQAKAAGQEPGAFVDQITGALPNWYGTDGETTLNTPTQLRARALFPIVGP